ncbi:glycyl-radical enzyme activating protein [Zophobihabitans entericus]|uniref:Glycyl-radical enzyme activating protein n=1 Tax=Zophobihabitans entericus TaxID=1635327 RepID=A0A6G9IBX0_9GAMM|nr:glycyl-radical enzyme activating protein [Zophobihabitans entericus]QIQ21728.1 glycyl-radical enzyme activating protein [Zophobihabitans entericus]
MIFNIQRYSTHDGPGIRTVVFLKGCSLGCRWCQNPESRSDKKQVLFDARLCIADCQLCCTSIPHGFNKANQTLTIDRSQLTEQDYQKLEKLCPSLALTVCGKDTSVDDIMSAVKKDVAFYERTGGGVTLSGGEPFMQPDLCAEILKRCHHENYHTAVETCLHVPWKYIEPSLPYLNLFLADLKQINDVIFKQWTDGSAARILDNFRRLAKTDIEMIIRVPLIQGFNADEKSVKAIIDFTADESSAKEIHFLPYHTLGINKYNMLNMSYQAPLTPLDDSALIEYAQNYASEKNLTAILRG